MKPRWLGQFPITQVNYQDNNYTLDLSRNAELCHIHKTLPIELLKPYRENDQQEFLQHHHSEPGPVMDDRYKVEMAVNIRFSYAARGPLYHIRWKEFLPSQYQ